VLNESGAKRLSFVIFLIFVLLPVDQELRTIIDKLAVFVARNGPDFEQMTKTKQKDNPKFEFLFGGRYFDYYLRKVSTEQSSEWCLKTHQQAITSCRHY
jgi:calcium homeostasis ER protein